MEVFLSYFCNPNLQLDYQLQTNQFRFSLSQRLTCLATQLREFSSPGGTHPPMTFKVIFGLSSAWVSVFLIVLIYVSHIRNEKHLPLQQQPPPLSLKMANVSYIKSCKYRARFQQPPDNSSPTMIYTTKRETKHKLAKYEVLLGESPRVEGNHQ